MMISLSTPWNELLDAASDGGMECHITLSDGGFGSLSFDIMAGGATSAGLDAANLATRLFDMGGRSCHDMFSHCIEMGAIYRNFSDGGALRFRGPICKALPHILAEVRK